MNPSNIYEGLEVESFRVDTRKRMNTVLAENLYQAIKSVKQTEFSSLPVLNHVKIEFKEGWLHVTKTDLENTLQAKCAARVEQEFSTCVPMIVKVSYYDTSKKSAPKVTRKYYPFLDYLRVMAEYKEVLEIEFIENIQTLVIYCGKSKTEFRCIDSSEFPPIAPN